MAAGFIEPLEASALVMVELAANYIRDQMPQHKSVMPLLAKRFNDLQTYRWNNIVDFIKFPKHGSSLSEKAGFYKSIAYV